MRTLLVELSSGTKFDAVFGGNRCGFFRGHRVGHHPYAQLALAPPGIEKRKHEIGEVLLGLVERTQVRAVTDITQDGGEHLGCDLSGPAHDCLLQPRIAR